MFLLHYSMPGSDLVIHVAVDLEYTGGTANVDIAGERYKVTRMYQTITMMFASDLSYAGTYIHATVTFQLSKQKLILQIFIKPLDTCNNSTTITEIHMIDGTIHRFTKCGQSATFVGEFVVLKYSLSPNEYVMYIMFNLRYIAQQI